MKKKILILLLVFWTFLFLTSCGLDYRYSLDKNKHNRIDVIMENDEPTSIIYQDSNYVFVGSTNFFSVNTYNTEDGYCLSYEDDILLSWNGHRYVWYIDEYYSYTTDTPLFIYNSRLEWVYFHENYDYFSDTFVIDNSGSEIIWNDIFISKQTNIDFVSQYKISLYSKQCPRIKTSLEIAFIENQWYLYLPGSQEIWVPSDKFITILSDNSLI